MNFIPYGRQIISQDDINEVVSVLRSDMITQGPAVPRFESDVASKCGAAHAVAANSATSALHIACIALGLSEGGRLWTVPNTFVASANCGLYCGAEIDFVDIDNETLNIDVNKLKNKLIQARKNDALPHIVVPVHFSGQPVEQELIWDLAEEFDFKVLEDASHAIGASRHSEAVGSCRWSHVTVFSFHPVKIITSGEGGMALTNDPEIAWRMSILRSHGITRDDERMIQTDPPPWAYEQQMLGFNYRMTDIQAALGASQLLRLDEWVARRNELAGRYDEKLLGLPLKPQRIIKGNHSSYHIYVVQLHERLEGEEHRRIFESLRRRKIGVNLHYTPVHLQPLYQRLSFCEGMFPVAESYARRAITLPLHPCLSEEDQNRISEALSDELN